MNRISSPACDLTTATRRLADIAGPRGWPLLGNLPQFDLQHLHAQFEAWARKYGPIYRLRFGTRDALVVSRPDLVAAIFRDRPDGWRRLETMRTVLREIGIDGLFTAEGEDWKRQRRLVMAAFDPAHLKRYFPSLRRVTERLKQRLDAAASTGEWIDLQHLLMRYTVDVTSGLAFGIDINTQQNPDNVVQGHLDKVFPMLMRRTNALVPIWRYLKLPSDRAFDRHLAEIHKAIRQFVRQARERIAVDPSLKEHPTNLLEAMLAAHDDAGGFLDEDEVVGNVFTMLLAGEDTTANTLCWTLYLLHTHRDAWQEVVSEVDQVLGPERLPCSFEAARELDTIEHSASESMRLRPVAPVHYSENNYPTVLDDIALPTGTFVISLTRPGAVDRDEASDAGDFRPSRWRQIAASVERERQPAQRAVLKASVPFGGGPRTCPGRYLAMLEMKMVLAVVARNYDLVEVGTEHGTPPVERAAFTMYPEGLRMRIRSRSEGAVAD